MPSKCPECGGAMISRQDGTGLLACVSCGLTMNRQELENYWRTIRFQNLKEDDDLQKKKSKKKEWLDWYSKSKSDKEAL